MSFIAAKIHLFPFRMSSSSPAGSSGISITETVYRQSENMPLKALIYRPAGEGPFPAVVCVHGGAWVAGDRFATQGFAERVAQTGIVVMAIDTRLAPQHPYPAAVADVNCATRWLKHHAAEYGADPLRTGGLGISSGGYLVLLSAMRFDDPRYCQEKPANLPLTALTDARMAFVVTCSGVLDPLARFALAEKNGNLAITLCHRAFFRNPQTMEEANPPLILSRHEKADLPPALFFQGSDDPRLPPDTAAKTAAAWRKAGGRGKAILYPETGHAVGTWRRKELADMLSRLHELASGSLSS
ncbi:hypothetical protein OFAG_00696 [Oxalobacter formigenes HOxBLS]|uniref:BD-FAE-like domain-containing protein n=2 Tax=Oxalobacter paraformigenes TaxID=556268 RepID=C3X2V7_9BURK|nr:alpha/beta hydrolase [Oxalobacter paraformigenes]EEO27543.1 hypothetical protein OFAG_00696 [Oxalobacter paraformigenes]